MGAWGEGVWDNDSALDLLDGIKSDLIIVMKNTSKGENPSYDVLDLMGAIDVFLRLPHVRSDDAKSIEKYVDRILDIEDFSSWRDPALREKAVKEFVSWAKGQIQMRQHA